MMLVWATVTAEVVDVTAVMFLTLFATAAVAVTCAAAATSTLVETTVVRACSEMTLVCEMLFILRRGCFEVDPRYMRQ